MSALAKAAVAYAERGWHVFPLAPREKAPLGRLVPRGFLQASAEREQVRAWWAAEPQANIGLVPGPSGFVVLDVDGPEGEQAAIRLGLYAEPTLAATTGRADGGRHLYFRHPGGVIPNGKLAPKLDIRADAGYVVAPPSIHPTGTPYRWEGKLADLLDLPADLVAPVRGASFVPAPASGQRPASALVFAGTGEGGRNDALTRYAARLLSRALPLDEITVLLLAVNAEHCTPPLSEDEVRAIVASMAKTHARRTGEPVVQSAAPAPVEAEPEQTPDALAAVQTQGALALLSRDTAQAVRWNWPDVHQLVGPMYPGDLIVVGALSGSGKTTLMRNQADAWEQAGVSVLYLPLEVDAEVMRLQWAAQRCGFPLPAVMRNEWHRLPEGAREELAGALDDLSTSRCLHFVPDRRVTVGSLARWIAWGREHVHARLVVIDHFHRMSFGQGGDGYRIAVTEAARHLKDTAREHGVTIVATAQLNRTTDPLDPFRPPTPARIKESAGLMEEADVLLMLSRVLKATVSPAELKELGLGRIDEQQIADPTAMRVTCRKHRLDATVWNKSARLVVRDGRVWSVTTREPAAAWYEREAEA